MRRPRGGTKASKAIDRLYQQAQCRECSVVVSRMDFAKILGKFTKVKIQYESSSPSKEKQKSISKVASPTSNSRLKSNENGMVLIHRHAYNQHPVKEVLTVKKQVPQPKTATKIVNNNNNILKENNRLKKTPVAVKRIAKEDKGIAISSKEETPKKPINQNLNYGIVFLKPDTNACGDSPNSITLLDLVPSIDQMLLPSNDWSIHYLPHVEEPKKDKVYDRIAAELEDLMYNEKTTVNNNDKKIETTNSKDDFPSILDILNEKPEVSLPNQKPLENKISLTQSDVEAMLLDNSKVSKDAEMEIKNEEKNINNVDMPGSPSILDETLQKGIAEQLVDKNDDSVESKNNAQSQVVKSEDMDVDETPSKEIKPTRMEIDTNSPPREITHLVFKHIKNDSCLKSVTCPKTLKYNIEFEGKPVELLGAPKYISKLEDLKVLLQIVHETELESFYVLH